MFGYTLIKTYDLNKLKLQAAGNNNVAYAKGYAAGRSAAEERHRINAIKDRIRRGETKNINETSFA